MFKTSEYDTHSEERFIFNLLLGYRWASLILPLAWLIIAPTGIALFAFLATAGLSLYLTPFAGRAGQAAEHQLRLSGFDLVVAAVVVWLTGAAQSPYYLYSLAPILTAAFFFHIRGGLIAAVVYSGLYLVACAIPRPANAVPEVNNIVGQMLSFFLIGGIFGYASHMIERLHRTRREMAQKNNELVKRNRDLRLVRELSLVMQSSIDPAALQESISRGIVNDLGYQRVIIGLYDEGPDMLSSWITITANEDQKPRQLAHTATVSLVGDTGPLARALKGKLVVEVVDGEAPAFALLSNNALVTGSHYIVLPLSLRGQPIGVIIVDQLPSEQRLPQVDRISLENLATHAGVALGSMRLCIDHAQQTAITEERNRIAIDLHDNVSQILYGLAYGLEACAQMLPEQSDIRNILNQLHNNVSEAQSFLRQTIFDIRTEAVTSERFVAGLHRQLRTICPQSTVTLRIDLPGDFDQLESTLRENLYQIAHEALSNAAKHAQATHIVVKLHFIEPHEIELRISDDGEGFDPQIIEGQHLGLTSIAERTNSFNGELSIYSTFGEGTSLTIKAPVETHLGNGKNARLVPL
jgi:signal transduction histidine kinase